MPENRAKRWAVISLFIVIISVAMTTAGIVLEELNLYWMILVGLMLGITFLICFFIFRVQGARFQRMLSGAELLAHWSFEPEEHREKVEQEYQAKKKTNRTLVIIITVFFVLIGGGFTVLGFDDIDEASTFLLIMLFVLGCIYMAALISTLGSRRRMLHSSPEIYIGPYCAWVMGETIAWRAPMPRLMRVAFFSEEGSTLIAIHTRTRQRHGYQDNVSRIPVPAGKEREALAVANGIAVANGVELVADDGACGQTTT